MTASAHHHPGAPFWPGRIGAALPLVLFVCVAWQLPKLASGQHLRFDAAWAPSLGVSLSFVLDGLSGLYALIITGIGALVFIYADAYMAGHARLARFHLYLHAFLLAMLGLVLADNLVVMFVFWELTTLISFLLIGFEHEGDTARQHARQALLVTGGGGLLLLVGILLIGQVSGSYSLSKLASLGAIVRSDGLYLLILICMLAGAFTKSAQVPFHFWLPNAMSAPTPISAFLHSATMVKAGVYLLTRLHPVLGNTGPWMITLVLVGATTAVWGAIIALAQSDLKRMLAYTTIMALGIITMFLGGQTPPALTAAVTFLLVHALYKSALFMVVGAIDHQAGTRQIDQLGGLWRHMPVTALAAAMAALSMSGFPLFLGFIGKEIMYKGALTEPVFPYLATSAAVTANALMVAAAAIVAICPFWRALRADQPVVEAPWQMLAGPLLLSGIGLGFGLIPDWVARWLVEPAVRAFHPTGDQIQLTLFHGINAPLLLSLLTMILGVLIYWRRHYLGHLIMKLLHRLPVDMAAVYECALDRLARLADWQTRWLQNGSLFQYLVVIIGSMVLAVGAALVSAGIPGLNEDAWSVSGWQGLLVLIMLTSLVVVVRTTARLLAICALGVVGAGMALIFLSFGAPDVALTQLLVETLTLVIAAMVLLRLPCMPAPGTGGRLRRGTRLAVALGSGVLVTALLLAVSQVAPDRSLTEFYEQASLVKAHGRNIVNVILVDFRGLDTLGEIVVVAASAIAGYALIRKGRGA